jgi:hypothetical protein
VGETHEPIKIETSAKPEEKKTKEEAQKPENATLPRDEKNGKAAGSK